MARARKAAAKQTTETKAAHPKLADEIKRIMERASPMKVAVDSCRPNSWNYKPMTEEELGKEIASIRKHGFVVPTVVGSATPKGPLGFYEIIDGEHRWRALKAIGSAEIFIVDIGEATDREAKELTVILNELHGSPEFDALGALLHSIAEDTSVEEMLTTMPFPEEEMRALINLGEDPMKDYGSTPAPSVGTSPTKDWETLKFRVPPGGKEIVEGAIAAALGLDKLCAPKDVKEGIELDRVCRDYMGVPQRSEEEETGNEEPG